MQCRFQSGRRVMPLLIDRLDHAAEVLAAEDVDVEMGHFLVSLAAGKAKRDAKSIASEKRRLRRIV